MPKKKVNAVEEPEQTADVLAEQAEEEALALPEEPPQDTNPSGGALPPESGETGDVPPFPGDAPGLPEDGEGAPEEVMAVDVSGPPPEAGPEGGESSDAVLPRAASRSFCLLRMNRHPSRRNPRPGGNHPRRGPGRTARTSSPWTSARWTGTLPPRNARRGAPSMPPSGAAAPCPAPSSARTPTP